MSSRLLILSLLALLASAQLPTCTTTHQITCVTTDGGFALSDVLCLSAPATCSSAICVPSKWAATFACMDRTCAPAAGPPTTEAACKSTYQVCTSAVQTAICSTTGGTPTTAAPAGPVATPSPPAPGATPTPPVSCTSSAAQAALATVMGSCQAASETASTAIDSIATAQLAYNEFCTSSCVTTLIPAYVTGPYGICLAANKDLREGIAGVQLECQSHGGVRCGALYNYMRVGASCSSRSSISCASSPYMCVYDTRSQQCRPNVTSTYLNTICSEPCLGLALRHYAGKNSGSGRMINYVAGTLCAKVDTTWCHPLLQNTVLYTAETDVPTNASLAAMCANPVQMRCNAKIAQAQAGEKLQQAASQFQSCALQYGTASSIDRFCAPSFVSAWQNLKGEQRSIGDMCLQNANHGYCLQYINVAFKQCWQYALGGLGCTSTCAAEIATDIAAMGCCVGNLEDLIWLSNVHPAAADFPKHTRSGTDTAPPTAFRVTAGPTTTAVTLAANEELRENTDGSFFTTIAFRGCGPTTLPNLLQKRCAAPVVAAVKKTLSMKIAYSAIQADPALAKRMLLALINDIAQSLGISADEIINATLKRSTAVVVTITATSAHSLRAMATEAGTDLDFAVQTSNAAVTAAAAASFDTAVASSSLVLTSTAAEITASCESTCVSAAGVGSINDASSSTSGSSALATFAAIAVAVLALLA